MDGKFILTKRDCNRTVPVPLLVEQTTTILGPRDELKVTVTSFPPSNDNDLPQTEGCPRGDDDVFHTEIMKSTTTFRT